MSSREDEKLLAVVQNKNKENSPMIYLDSMEEMDSFDGLKLPGPGYSFAPEDSE